MHVKLADSVGGDEVIVPMWVVGDEAYPGSPAKRGDLHIPSKLAFAAVWLYDIEKRKVIKNKTDKPLLVPMGVPRVTRQWLVEKGYIRVRRNPQP